MPPETPPAKLHVAYERPDPNKACTALYTLQFTAAAQGGRPGDATLSLHFERVGDTFRKRLSLEDTPASFWLAIDTHLLPDGPNDIRVTLEAAGCSSYTDTFSLNVLNDGTLAERVRESLIARRTPLVFDGLVDAESFDTSERSLLPWYDRRGAQAHIDALVEHREVSAQDALDLQFLVENGYVRLSAQVEPAAIAAANAAIDDAISKKYQNYEYGSSQRIEHLHEHYEAIRHLWQYPAVLRFLRFVFDTEPLPCQTLAYVFGSQQDLHQDTIHLTSFPSGYMCGVWIALEDIRPDSGELVVVPKSHRLQRLYRKSVGCGVVRNNDWSEFGEKVVSEWQRMHRESELPLQTYRPKTGSILIWLDSLLHGGSIRKDISLTRRSIVSHYFASGSIAYYDSTGMPGWVHR